MDYEWPFSFQNVCETLGINPESLRGTLLGWKAKRLAVLEVTALHAKKVYRLRLL